jgi:hypothetical protein
MGTASSGDAPLAPPQAGDSVTVGTRHNSPTHSTRVRDRNRAVMSRSPHSTTPDPSGPRPCAIIGRMGMQIRTLVSTCPACLMDSPVFECTNTSRLPPLPQRAEESHEPAPDVASDRRRLSTDGWRYTPQERGRQPVFRRPSRWSERASRTVRRGVRWEPRRFTSSPERPERQRVRSPNREERTVRHGSAPNPHEPENPPAPSPPQPAATTRTKRPRQLNPPRPPSTTL